jgi:hypothetical protein
MLMQTINLLVSAAPKYLGAAGQGRCTPVAGVGGAPTGFGEDNCKVPLPAGPGDDVDAHAEAMTLRTVGRQGVQRAAEPWRRRPTRGLWGSGAPEAGAGRGGSHSRSGGRRRQTGGVAGGEGVGGFREAAGGGESRGAEDGGHRGRRRSGRMTATAAAEDTTTTMAADRGRKSG